ncbi:MAG: hypothetical protein KBONHNOK_00716 [Candidatus Methanoperedenaceae archaeon GB50]|nr:MAG: hypothetical protein KBONHNOK_00716 [Candidatus Methanoperedenaceae archaeon GB50]
MKIMQSDKNGIQIIIILISVMIFVGSAQAAAPVMGQVNSTTIDNTHIVTLYLDVNPSLTLNTTTIDGSSLTPPLDYYMFGDITPLLTAAGIGWGQPYNATIEMRCGYGSNQYRNTTPTTAHVSGVNEGNTYFPSLMELEQCAAGETFSKPLCEGWNLISLPLVPENNSAGAVLSGVSCDAVYRYNATSKQFEVADVMNPGTGYFVHATADCTWEYSGTPYTSMSISLEHGLNMVGWLNCSMDISDALSSISGRYHYVARWNATAQRFEVYNPRAPAVFNDFTTIDRGRGYFISAREECTLSESC